MDAISGQSGHFFLSSDVTRWSSVLYREYCIQEGDLDPCSVANIPGGVLRTPVNPDTCRIRVDGQIRFPFRIRADVEISESGKKKLRLQKYPDKCRRMGPKNSFFLLFK